MSAPPSRGMSNCEKKRRHADEMTARAAAMNALREHGSAFVLWVYKCKTCHGWHLTRSPNGVAMLVTAENLVYETGERRLARLLSEQQAAIRASV